MRTGLIPTPALGFGVHFFSPTGSLSDVKNINHPIFKFDDKLPPMDGRNDWITFAYV